MADIRKERAEKYGKRERARPSVLLRGATLPIFYATNLFKMPRISKEKLRKREKGSLEEYQKNLDNAIRKYKELLGTKSEISIRQAAKDHGITRWEALRDRLRGKRTKQQFQAELQGLTPVEEGILFH